MFSLNIFAQFFVGQELVKLTHKCSFRQGLLTFLVVDAQLHRLESFMRTLEMEHFPAHAGLKRSTLAPRLPSMPCGLFSPSEPF